MLLQLSIIDSQKKMSTKNKTLKSRPKHSKKSKVLVFFRVCSFNMPAPYILSGDDLGDFSGIFGKPSIWRPTISQEHAVEKL